LALLGPTAAPDPLLSFYVSTSESNIPGKNQNKSHFFFSFGSLLSIGAPQKVPVVAINPASEDKLHIRPSGLREFSWKL
jgi:hypothetical protein